MGFWPSTSLYCVCVAGRRQQASKEYEKLTDIIMHNILLISQQHQQILALGFFMNCTWPPRGSFTASWERLEECGPWWAQDEPRNEAAVHSSGQHCSMNNSGFSRSKKCDIQQKRTCCSWKQTMLIWVRALPSHFNKVMWLRICLMEISGRILAIQGHGAIPFFEPILPLPPKLC